MPEHIRALLVVLVLGSLVWVAVRPAMVQVISAQTFSSWRMLWYAATLAWFLANSFWIYVAILVPVLLVVGRRETHVFGLFLLLLVVAPPAAAPIPGFGIVEFIFMLDHYRLLALALLLPCAWRLANRKSTVRFLQSPVDWMVLGYIALNTLLAFRQGNFTSDARTALMLWIDFFLPYYVASRSIQTKDGFRHALAGLVLAGVLLAVLGAFEVWRSWKLYDAASANLGLHTYGLYKIRGGFIRPSATVIDSIVLGFTIVAATGAYLYLHTLIKTSLWRRLGWLVLSIGVLASLSRGPWVGALLLLLVFIVTSPRPIKRLFQSAVAATCVGILLSAAPGGQQFVNLLPFVGEEEQGNVEYRANLLTASIPVIGRNPLFGSSDFINAPELEVMRQGEGIIDIVNSYLGVVLHAGLVGGGLFAGIFLSALFVVRRRMRLARIARDTDTHTLGRALFATVLGIMFIILTVSSILIVPILYFSVVGICCAFHFLKDDEDHAKPASATI